MDVAEVNRRLTHETRFWVEELGVQVEDPAGNVVKVKPRWAQLEFDRLIGEQREKTGAVRAVVLKSRKVGISTWVQLGGTQRATRRENQGVYTIAHDVRTAGILWKMAWRAYTSLPNDREVKPPLRNKRTNEVLEFGETSRFAQQRGDLGINSTIEVQTAKEAEGGRGYTIHKVHGSEVAHWPDINRKLLAIQNAVPDGADTEIVLESTAKGHNEFKKVWDDAENGRSDYIAIFIPWWRDPACSREFLNAADRELFVKSIGQGVDGEEELRLIEAFGVTPEQLYWRRTAIANKAGGDVQWFNQEYPASAEEAFVATGRTVFPGVLVKKAADRAAAAGDPEEGVLQIGGTTKSYGRVGEQTVPTSALWVPREATGFGARHNFWRVWDHPDAGLTDTEAEQIEEEPRPPGQYICSLDPAEPDEDTEQGAANAITVIDHRTRLQVAELETFIDPDLAGVQLLLAALYWNDAVIAVETTGGYGGSVARWLYMDVHYPFMYFRKKQTDRKEKPEQRLGWDTNRVIKPFLHDHFRMALREGSDGIRSVRLAKQLTTYVQLNRTRTGPQAGYLADLLMSYLIGQYVAAETPLRPDRGKGYGVVDMSGRPRNPVTGY